MEMHSLKAFLEDTSTNFGNALDRENWDEYSFRVQTFVSDGSYQSYWLLKPIALSPAVCARYGWKCIAKDMIQCTTCNEVLCGKLPKVWESNTYDQCVQEKKDLLIKAHKEVCPWPTAPCPESFVKMEVMSKQVAFKLYTHRLESLLQCTHLLPDINEEILPDVELTCDDLQSLCRRSNIPFNNTNTTVVISAMLGWEAIDMECQKFLYCTDCHRLVALWRYNTSDTEQTENFNPLYEHRHWCKWITPGLPQSKENADLGFKIFRDNVLKMIDKDEHPIPYSGKYRHLDLENVLQMEVNLM